MISVAGGDACHGELTPAGNVIKLGKKKTIHPQKTIRVKSQRHVISIGLSLFSNINAIGVACLLNQVNHSQR